MSYFHCFFFFVNRPKFPTYKQLIPHLLAFFVLLRKQRLVLGSLDSLLAPMYYQRLHILSIWENIQPVDSNKSNKLKFFTAWKFKSVFNHIFIFEPQNWLCFLLFRSAFVSVRFFRQKILQVRRCYPFFQKLFTMSVAINNLSLCFNGDFPRLLEGSETLSASFIRISWSKKDASYTTIFYEFLWKNRERNILASRDGFLQ